MQERLDNLDDLRDIDQIITSGKRGKKGTGEYMDMDAEHENSKFAKSLNNYVKNAGKKANDKK